jgi:ATP/maltotriose-dependent transcriptional regulator MalT
MADVEGAPDTAVGAARAAYDARDWVTARDTFDSAAEVVEQDPVLLYARANCDWWLGQLAAAFPRLERAHRLFLEHEDAASAAMVALDTGYTHLLRGEQAQGSGWIARGTRLLEPLPPCPEHGYLTHIEVEEALASGDLDAAYASACRVAEHGSRFGDATLIALGALGRGRVLVRRGRLAEGLPLLDEAMVAAVSDRLDPSWAGNIYCHLMVACIEIADLQRAGEWTDVTARWCESMPGAGPFLGICRVHRAQLLQVRGEWEQVERDLALVVEQLADFEVEVVAEAHYVRGEVLRLRGDLDSAERAYRDAHTLGRDPQPGLAALALARGRAAAAWASARAALEGVDDPLRRAPLLPFGTEAAAAVGDVEAAETLTAELERLAAVYGTAGFAAQAATARGRAELAAGRAGDAVPALRNAVSRWRHLHAPLEVAVARELLAAAFSRLGDDDAARLEREAAAAARARLGVPPAAGPARAPRNDGLSPREAEVLGLVADGLSNSEIAAQLVLSVRTVERHLATVYGKLGLRGRAARAAAVRHVLDPGRVPVPRAADHAEPRGASA